jgi:hypothetical protein
LGEGRAVAAAERRRDALGAQDYGGVLYMAKGTALFDAVAISGTEAAVRGSGRMRGWGGGRRTGCGADCNRRGCAGCAQDYGGVVRMLDGAVTFKGGSISNTNAVSLRLARVARPGAVVWYVMRGAARPVVRAHGAAHACCSEWSTVYGTCGRRGACQYAFRIVAEGAAPSGRGVLHSAARAACAARCAFARHTPRSEVFQTGGCSHRGIPCAEAT